MSDDKAILLVEDNPDDFELYKNRIVSQIFTKIQKARKEYNKDHPLILAIYVNEYVSIHIGLNEWRIFIESEEIFDSIEPFKEIVFWSLGNHRAISVT